MSRLPPLDAHAHINPEIDGGELDALNAVVFAVSRSLQEAQAAVERTDRLVVWGVGCHPGVAKAQNEFSEHGFSALLDRSAMAGELGLDGKSRVPMAKQQEVLLAALRVLEGKPRLASLHSFGATEPLLAALEAVPVPGLILHWWLGDTQETDLAVRLGCYFSINASAASRTDILPLIPPQRVLTETDHPYGDRRSPTPRRPGATGDVEAALARHYGVSPSALRAEMWRNLGRLVADTGCSTLIPRSIRSHLATIN